MNDADLVLRAIELAREARTRGDPPFGAVIARGDGRIVARSANTVASDGLSTRHAEINVIEQAQRQLGRRNLRGLTLASSAEPCPMCAGAIHWAGLGRLVYGASIPALAASTPGGHRQLLLRCEEVLAGSACVVCGPVEETLALAVFRDAGA